MTGWDFVGDDSDALAHDGHLPEDWRTVARALLDYSREVGRYEALELWRSDDPAGMVHHGWKCEAPPGEWWGGWYVTWHEPEKQPYLDAGWVAIEDYHHHGGGPDCQDTPIGSQCLGLDAWDDEAVQAALAAAPREVCAITPGDGWPWLCRLHGPVTVVTLDT